ncbi:hypothetical protein ACWDF5_51165, partial [Streptomyces sp. NPDC001076]
RAVVAGCWSSGFTYRCPQAPLVAGAALLAVSCASLAEAASDSERMIEGAQFAACVTALKDTGMPAQPPAHGPCGHPPRDHDEPGRYPR